MSVMIRLSRQGAKKEPQYQVVVMDSGKKRDGEYLDRLGHYFPKAARPADKLKVDLEKVKSWQAKGAQVTKTVGQLLKIKAN